MISVLMLIPNLRVSNGIASFAMNYFRNLDHQQVHMDFALYEERPSPYYDEIRQVGGKIFFLPSVKNIRSHIKVCMEILEQGYYDIVHDNSLHITLPMMACAKVCCVPVRILHSHNSKMGETRYKEMRNRLFLPILRSMATDYMACSNAAGYTLFGRNCFTVMPNVISTKKFVFDQNKRKNIREKLGAGSKYVIGVVGRLARQKNPFFAIDVFQEFINICPNAELWWVGNGPLEDDVNQHIKSKGLINAVRLLGSRNDVVDLYQAMDVFFMPSLFEGLPLTGVEAQAMGLPIVVSGTITNEMMYTDLVDFVSLSGSVGVWANHLKKALDRKVNRGSYSDKLKNSVFSDIECGERLTNLYTKLLYKHGGK